MSRVQQGQVSRARQGLTVAPKTLDTLAELQGRRPQVRGMAIPQNVMEFVPERPVELDVALFTKCLRSAPSGSASGPGGYTNEMLRVCLDDELFQLLFRAVEDTAKADMPESVQKPDGGVRGIATGTSSVGSWRERWPANSGRQSKQHALHFSSPFRRGRAPIAWTMQSGHSRMLIQ